MYIRCGYILVYQSCCMQYESLQYPSTMRSDSLFRLSAHHLHPSFTLHSADLIRNWCSQQHNLCFTHVKHWRDRPPRRGRVAVPLVDPPTPASKFRGLTPDTPYLALVGSTNPSSLSAMRLEGQQPPSSPPPPAWHTLPYIQYISVNTPHDLKDIEPAKGQPHQSSSVRVRSGLFLLKYE